MGKTNDTITANYPIAVRNLAAVAALTYPDHDMRTMIEHYNDYAYLRFYTNSALINNAKFSYLVIGILP